jgi:predicted RNA polymerase sigma factor
VHAVVAELSRRHGAAGAARDALDRALAMPLSAPVRERLIQQRAALAVGPDPAA